MDNNRMFVNPYNFVPLGDGSKRPCSFTDNESLTGEIACTLKIKTPLAIPNTEGQPTDDKIEKKYEFMSVDEKHIIPGSEIRGMIRNVYETITDSCLSVINNSIITKRETSAFKGTGLVKWNGAQWELYQAKRTPTYSPTTIKNKTNSLKGKVYVVRNWKFFTGLNLIGLKGTVNEKIKSSRDFEAFERALAEAKWFIKPNGDTEDINSVTIGKGRSKGVNITKKWGAHYGRTELEKVFGQKVLDDKYTESAECVSIFEPVNSSPIIIEEDLIDNLTEVLESYAFYGSQKKEAFDAVTPKKDGALYPVFFSYKTEAGPKPNFTADSIDRLAPAQMSRVAFKNSVPKLLGEYKPCSEAGKLCPGCSLFGTVIKGNAKAARVRFCDAVPSGKITVSEDFVPIKVLSSPKITSVEFYSLCDGLKTFENQPKWNHDSKGVYLRGRKFYLHNPKAAEDASVYSEDGFIYSESKKPLNAAYKLAKSGKFTFKVFFERISKKELQNLVWSLTLGNEAGKETYCHKLGHGKPIGLGSVIISVDEIKKRTVSEGYKIEPITRKELMEDYTLPIDKTATLNALLAICNYSYAKGENIAYPLGFKKSTKQRPKKSDEENTMFWFSANHGDIKTDQKFKHVLHPVVSKDGTMHKASTLRLPYLINENRSASTTGYHTGNHRNGNYNRNGSNYRKNGGNSPK